jgi:hypothetical protein
VRKSLLSTLYGNYVAKGKIRLDDTLLELHIDDIGGLSTAEAIAVMVGGISQATFFNDGKLTPGGSYGRSDRIRRYCGMVGRKPRHLTEGSTGGPIRQPRQFLSRGTVPARPGPCLGAAAIASGCRSPCGACKLLFP